MRWVDLEPYKHSPFGEYVRRYMTPSAVAVRILGTVVTHMEAWYRRPALLPFGFGLVLVGWLRGVVPVGQENRGYVPPKSTK
jgi:hypothetical protein